MNPSDWAQSLAITTRISIHLENHRETWRWWSCRKGMIPSKMKLICYSKTERTAITETWHANLRELWFSINHSNRWVTKRLKRCRIYKTKNHTLLNNCLWKKNGATPRKTHKRHFRTSTYRLRTTGNNSIIYRKKLLTKLLQSQS